MIDIRIVSSERERNDAFAVRIAVFVDEQRIPREEELDDLDATAVHVVGYVDGAPVAAGRLVIADARDPGRYGKIGRMAVLREHRGRGFGAMVLEALEGEAVARGISDFRLSAQLAARGFYDHLGYVGVGAMYHEVGIPHIAMRKRL